MATRKSSTRPAGAAKTSKTAKATKAATKRATKLTAKRAGKATQARDPLARLRKICLELPETTEVESWSAPTFRVKNKIFAYYASETSSHGSGRPAVWIMSVSMEQDLVLRARPERYFKPPYVGPSGWIGAWLDRNPPWAEIEELLRDAWLRRAPKRLAAMLTEP